MASSSRRGLRHPPRDARQLGLNFCLSESRLISSADGDLNMDDAVGGEHGTPNSSEVTMLQNPPKIFLRIANERLDVDDCTGQNLMVD